MLSRELILADLLVAALDGTTFNGKTTAAARAYFLQDRIEAIQQQADDTADVVVIPLAISDSEDFDRESDVDELRLSIVLLGRVTSYDNAQLDEWANTAQEIHDALRGLDELVDAATEECFERLQPPTRPAVWDAEWIRSMGVFATSIVVTYECEVEL